MTDGFSFADFDELVIIKEAIAGLPDGLVGALSFFDSNGDHMAVVEYDDGEGWTIRPGPDRVSNV